METILIVDDEAERRFEVLRVLKPWLSPSVKCRLLKDGTDILSHATSVGFPSFIITDVVMWDMNGIRAVSHLRKKGYKGPVIFVSSDPPFNDILEDLQATATWKPVTEDRLLPLVRQAAPHLLLDGDHFSG